jgi:hypothetical protein
LIPANGRFLLDTNIIIALLEGDEAVLSNLDLAPEVFVPAVALGSTARRIGSERPDSMTITVLGGTDYSLIARRYSDSQGASGPYTIAAHSTEGIFPSPSWSLDHVELGPKHGLEDLPNFSQIKHRGGADPKAGVKSSSGKPVPTCERATDPTFVRLVERKGTVRISAVLNHQVGRQQHRPRAKPHRVARSFQSRPPWACDGISSPSRGLLPPLRFMILSKALKSARACRSVK